MTPKLYKAADVCEMTGLQPYVLRSWEKEFPGIGVQKSPESARLYRQADVDQVVRIKQLVFGEGLTLAGARKRLDDTRAGESPAAPVHSVETETEMEEVLDLLGADARSRIAAVRTGLRSILDALSKAPGAVDIAHVRATAGSGNGSVRRGGPAGPPKAARKIVAAKRAAPTKRAASRKPARKSAGRRGRL